MNPILNRKGSIWTLGAMLAAFAGSSATAYAVDPKITLTPSMLTNEIVRGDVGLLVDEQALSGNPAAGTSGSPTTVWTQSIGYDNGNWYFPASAIIDLGQTYNITNVSLYDMNNSGNIVIARGTPFSWTTVYTQTLDWYNSWRVQPTNFQTRYLRVTVVDGAATLGEIVLNGTPTGGTQPTPTPLPPVTRQRPTMEGFIGANAFNDDPVDKLTAVGFIREYHNWDWNPEQGAMFPSNRNYWNSTPSGFAFDNFYMAAKNAGLQVSPSIQDSTVNVLGPGVDLAHKPIAVGANPESPASYIQHADFMFQYAARYGNTSVADNLLKVNPDVEVPATNTKLINWYENWNEENKWWKDRAGYFTPFEMAAMSSADYDGDQGRLGTTVGIKNADPTAKMAIGGLAGIDIEYWKNMKLWADYNRGGSFPGDAINVHWYSSNGSNQGGNATSGISPEADDLKGRLQQLTEWRDNNLPNVEVWISEFGYDTSQDSPLRAPTIGPFSPAEVQGQWLVRGYLALAAAGVDRAQMYMFRDVASGDTGGIFGTSGLVTEKGSWTPKISWYYVSTLTKRLKGMRFDSVVNSGNANVYVYKFKLPNSAKTAYAVWCPTSNNTTVSNYQLAVGSSGVSGVKRIDLTSGQANGVETPLTITGGNVTLNVSERPTIVITDNAVPNATEVKVTSPADGAKFTTTDSINITAEVAYINNPITQVAFYRGSTLIGTDNVAPWSASASNLPAGVYDLKAVATDSTNATFNSPLVRIVVPSGTGLTGKYYNGSTFNTLVKTQIDPTINFDWGWGNYGNWDQSLDHNAFSVRWTGQIQALETGTYNIGSNYDDAIRVTINNGTNRKVIDQWTAGGSMYFVKSGPIYLIGGQKYDITVDYAQRATNGNGGLAAIGIKWIRPGQTAFEVVPSSQLYPTISGGSSGTGTGLTGQYYSGTGFNTLVNTRVDPTVDFDWGAGNAMTSVGPDNFSVRWTGQVETVEAGTYTFTTTTDDGAKLWVNNQLLVDKWVPQGSTAWSGTITLSANQKYDIKMEYFENGGQAVAQLKWQRPGQSTAVIIPQTQLYPASGVTPTPTPTVAPTATPTPAPTATPTPTPTATPTPTPTPSPGTGLKGQYYNDMTLTNLITTRTDSTVDFDWGYGSPVAGVGSNNFSASWNGQVKAVESGSYTFTTNTDDGVKLWVNNQLLVDKWVPQAPTLWSGNISLTAGQKYDIKMEYYEDGGGALAQLQWLRPGQSTAVVIPQAQLYPAP